jgi:hypothetical protein
VAFHKSLRGSGDQAETGAGVVRLHDVRVSKVFGEKAQWYCVN